MLQPCHVQAADLTAWLAGTPFQQGETDDDELREIARFRRDRRPAV